jgi:hypothetical protein
MYNYRFRPGQITADRSKLFAGTRQANEDAVAEATRQGHAAVLAALARRAERIRHQETLNRVLLGARKRSWRVVTRVLKPGGKVMVLEFSKTDNPALTKLYDFYSFNILPKMGQAIAGDAESYRYLAESIRMHPDQETLKGMMQAAGLVQVKYQNMTGGVVALHTGIKP